MKQTNWSDVLTHFYKKGYVTNGLTVPFLIGAQQLLNGEGSYGIEEFIIGTSDYVITIMRCPMIGEYVIGTVDNETEQVINVQPNLYHRIGNFVCTDDSLKEILTLTHLSDYFRNEYLKQIQDKAFSLRDGEWVNFNQQEIERINEAIG